MAKLIFVYSEAGNPTRDNASSFNILDNAYVDPFGKIRKLFKVKKIPATFIINKNYIKLGRFDGYNKINIKKIKHIVFKK